jgi:hypothetical protein
MQLSCTLFDHSKQRSLCLVLLWLASKHLAAGSCRLTAWTVSKIPPSIVPTLCQASWPYCHCLAALHLVCRLTTCTG